MILKPFHVIALAVAGCVAPVAPEPESPAKMTYNPKLSAKANAAIAEQGLDAGEYYKEDDGCYWTVMSDDFEAVFRQLWDKTGSGQICD